jgi:hypothetical protein
MCFSATASFTAAAAIGAIGAITIRNTVGVRSAGIVALAAFPALFAAQQVVEGFLWLELARQEPGSLRPFLVHAFQGYAEVFWPVFAPLAAYRMETVAWRKRIILLCLAVGVCLSAYLLLRMIQYPYFASIADGHIVYKNGFNYPTGIEAPYVLATTVSLLLSSHRAVRNLAVVNLVGFAVAYVFVHHAYISVWCFFAAVASVLVYLHVRDVRIEARAS